MRSEGAENRWSLNSCAGGCSTGVWAHAASSMHNPSTAECFIGQIMRPAVSAVKQLLRVANARTGGQHRGLGDHMLGMGKEILMTLSVGKARRYCASTHVTSP